MANRTQNSEHTLSFAILADYRLYLTARNYHRKTAILFSELHGPVNRNILEVTKISQNEGKRLLQKRLLLYALQATSGIHYFHVPSSIALLCFLESLSTTEDSSLKKDSPNALTKKAG